MDGTVTFLMDNGSLEPEATRRLRVMAAALGREIGHPVAPVSLLHASAVSAAELDGTPAEILEPALERRAREGARDVVVVPLFFGPSRALTDYLPSRAAALRERWPGLAVRLAPPLVAAGDRRVARLLADHAAAAARRIGAERVVLVDHGSPVPAVTAVRDLLVGQLAEELGPGFRVAGACMERRPGAEYDFNGPLLADLLATEPWRHRPIVVALQFLLPGRHAGPEGDVAAIVRAAGAAAPELNAVLTPVLGEHPGLVPILADRWREGRAAPPLA